MSNYLVINGAITLYSFIDGEKRERVLVQVKLPVDGAKCWEGFPLNVLDWKAQGKTARVTYQTSTDLYAPIHDADWPIEQVRITLTPPTRSRNWQWRESSDTWQNIKTGERVHEYA